MKVLMIIITTVCTWFNSMAVTRTVKTVNELHTALKESLPGDSVWVIGTINATGNTFTIPMGVTLYGGRGANSYGALIYSTSFTAVIGGLPLIQTGGNKVTISGIRLRGATGEITDFDYKRGVSKGIHGNHPGLTVVNCEIMWFDMWGVYLYTPAEGLIVNNYIHHCRNAGYGYGVWVGGSGIKYEGTAVITRNIFDACRSAVDGSGHYSNMLITENTFLPEQHYTVISRHGQSNGCKGGNKTWVSKNIITADQYSFTIPETATDTGSIIITENRVRRVPAQYNKPASSIACLGDLVGDSTREYLPKVFGNTGFIPSFSIIVIANSDTVRIGSPVTVTATGADSYWWRFGDGLVDQGQRVSKTVTYTYPSPGVYIITCIGWKGLEPCIAYKTIVVLPVEGTWLTGWVKDSYIGSVTGQFMKHVLINGSRVWSDDVAGYEGWQRVNLRCDTLSSIGIEFRSPSGCPKATISEIFCWFDAFSVTTPTGVRFYDSFEGRVLWSMKTDNIGSNVSTQTPVGERRDGERCYLIRRGQADCGTNWGATLTYKVR